MANEWTDDDTARLHQLHGEGLSRNDIARTMGRSGATISKHAAAAGLSFERGPEVEAATAAKVADGKARRAQMMLKLLDDAERLRLQLFAPTTLHSFGGKDHTYRTAEVDQPLFRDQRDIMGAVSVALTASMRLDLHDGDPGVDDAKSMLRALTEGLNAAYEQLQQDEEASDGGD